MASLVFLALAYILSQFYRSFLAVLTPALTSELGATNSDLALASGIWFFTFACMQFAVGIALDRYGPRRTSSILLGFAGGGGVMLFAAAQSPLMIVAAMGLIGVGCSPVLMASLFIFARAYNPARFALLTSVFIGVGNFGNIFAASPMALAAESLGWRSVVAIIAVVTVIIAIALFMFVHDPEIDHTGDSSGLSGYLELLNIKALWFIIPLSIVGYSAVAGIRGLWVGPYLADVFGADAIQIGHLTLGMAVATALGSIAYGPLDAVFNTRKWVVVAGAALTVAALVFLALHPTGSMAMITLAMIIIGVSGTSYGVIMAHAKSSFPDHLTGRGVTLMNFFSIGGVALMQLATGEVAERAMIPDRPEAAYSALFAFYAAIFAIALLIYLFSRDAKPRTAQANR